MDDAVELDARMRAAFAAVHEAVMRLLRSGEHDPRQVALALARVTGEPGADVAHVVGGGRDGPGGLGRPRARGRERVTS